MFVIHRKIEMNKLLLIIIITAASVTAQADSITLPTPVLSCAEQGYSVEQCEQRAVEKELSAVKFGTFMRVISAGLNGYVDGYNRSMQNSRIHRQR